MNEAKARAGSKSMPSACNALLSRGDLCVRAHHSMSGRCSSGSCVGAPGSCPGASGSQRHWQASCRETVFLAHGIEHCYISLRIACLA